MRYVYRIFFFFFLTFFNFFLLNGQELIFNWGKHLQSSAGVSKVNSSVTDSLNNIYVTGSFAGTIDLDTTSAISDITSFGSSNSNCFIAKYSPAGSLVWVKVINSSISSVGLSISIDRSKNVCLTGYYEGTADFDPSPLTSFNLTTSAGTTRMFLAKLNSSGNFLWAKSIGGANSFGNAIVTDEFDNVIVSGYFPGKYILSKYDSLGNYVWQNDFLHQSLYEVSSIAIDSSNNIYFAVSYIDSLQLLSFSSVDTTLFSRGAGDIALIKYSNSGNLLWVNQIGGIGNDMVRANSIDANSEVVISGIYMDSVDFNPAGTTNYLYQNGSELPAFVCKYSPTGVLVWNKKITASTFLTPPFPILSSNGEVYITANFSDSIYFDSLSVLSKLTSNAAPGYFDVFLTKYSSNGNFETAQQIGGNASNVPTQISIDLNDDLILVGDFDGLFDVNPSTGFNSLYNPTASRAGFLVKYTSPLTDIVIHSKKALGISCFPNPFIQEVQVNFLDFNFPGTIYLYDAKSNLLEFYTVKNEKTIFINTNDWAKGFYLLKAVGNCGKTEYAKLIKCD